MNLKQILENIINQQNLMETCFEISKHVCRSYDPNDYHCIYGRWSDIIGLPECKNEEQYLDIIIKEYILNLLFKKSCWKHEILNEYLYQFDEEYIKNILMTLYDEKKLNINGDYVELHTIEKKRQQLLAKIEKATEDELDKML